MINPNICKRVLVEVSADQKTAVYRGVTLEINDYRAPAPKPGRRRMWLKFSIFSDKYYLTSRG